LPHCLLWAASLCQRRLFAASGGNPLHYEKAASVVDAFRTDEQQTPRPLNVACLQLCSAPTACPPKCSKDTPSKWPTFTKGRTWPGITEHGARCEDRGFYSVSAAPGHHFHTAMQRRLCGNWQRLHRLVYPAAALACLHLLWQARTDVGDALFYLAIFAALLL
jgi:hypothetical protein